MDLPERSFEGGLHIQAEHIHFQEGIPPYQPISCSPLAGEKEYFRSLLQKHQGNRSAVARELGVARSSLIYRLKRYGLA